MKTTRLSGLTAALTLAADAFPDLPSAGRDHCQPTGNGSRQPRQQLGHLCKPVPVVHSGPGLKQLNRKDRRSGGTTARQQRKLARLIRRTNQAALTNAFPTEQA